LGGTERPSLEPVFSHRGSPWWRPGLVRGARGGAPERRALAEGGGPRLGRVERGVDRGGELGHRPQRIRHRVVDSARRQVGQASEAQQVGGKEQMVRPSHTCFDSKRRASSKGLKSLERQSVSCQFGNSPRQDVTGGDGVTLRVRRRRASAGASLSSRISRLPAWRPAPASWRR